MTSLSHLDLSGNILEGDLSSTFREMTSLSHLDLSGNILEGDLSSIFQSLSCSNKSLMFLSLESNNLTGSLPDFTKFHSLTKLNLASNKLNGSFPSTFERRSNLVTLSLQENQLTGSVPDLSIFRSLRVLQLQNNQLNGTIHAGLGQLSRLEQLDISSNSLKGEISVSHLLNLSRLHHLDMSFNSLSFNVGSSWVPPFRLDTVGLASCRLGSRFPEWLRTQTNYVSLDMSHAGISDTIPFWFWNLSSRATFINLSHNKLRGELINPSTKNITASSFSAIDLSSNLLEGSLTRFFGDYDYLNLSRNSFSGSISFICKSAWMLGLDLSHNLFSGKLPDCWSGFDLSVLDLSNNNLSGELPSSFGSLIGLNSLHLRNNKFSGKIPSFFCNFTQLFYLDLGDNLFSGEIPKWMGHMLPNLTVLSLRNNSFSGKVPLELCRLSSIQILDLSTNNISGVIPNCLCSFAAMTQKLRPPVDIQDMNGTFSSIGPYRDYISLVIKGFIYEYKNHLELVKSVDLSSNMLGGIIPAEISCLTGLISLNLSGNNLIGPITVKIGMLKSLESLDLSNNHLSSQIPSTLSNLNFLGTLSLANNNLSGRIPTGTQIQSFDASAFAGNPRLCGDPLPKKCIEEGAKADENNNHKPKNNDEDIFLGLYISIALGFISGFWMVCGVLIFKRSWRYAYFRVWIHLYDRLYVITSLKLASVRRCFQA
ncbi:LRR receptor-like serine/threonine-protein kinase FLS2 [Chenopodium quinoa]|uniref:Uncharacterized protein n=1 Tax=Chenopodium quinoa TaxID=63459 RepID=A0A803MKW5_CHEQI|nr:LRR receptor-like serine/threonine-protein kinase FLS2 [Chenopodium quinoa]